MTFEESIFEETGYECITTFWSDFSIAERFGVEAIKDTFNRAFKEWRTNVKYFTELVLVLNHKIWYWYKKNDVYSRLYDQLWRAADEWAGENLKNPEEASYYYRTLD